MFFLPKNLFNQIYIKQFIYIVFFVFMFSLSKVVNKVVKLIYTPYAEMRSASCLGKHIGRLERNIKRRRGLPEDILQFETARDKVCPPRLCERAKR